MTSTFTAFRIHSEGGRIAARFEPLTLDDLAAGEVVIRVSHSGINYKDALAATGAGKILRRYPLVGGIDLAGVVEASSDARYRPGDAGLVPGTRPPPSARCPGRPPAPPAQQTAGAGSGPPAARAACTSGTTSPAAAGGGPGRPRRRSCPSSGAA